MEVFAEFLAKIADPQQRARMEEVLGWVATEFPALSPRIAWNQPMFTDHGTFIIAFSVAKKHFAVAPEYAGILHFAEEFEKAGYAYSNQLVRFPWDRPVDYALLQRMIEFNRVEKADCSTFWRK